MFRKEIFESEYLIRNATIADVDAMAFVQKECYPTLDPQEVMTREHFISHINIFPQGQLVLEYDGRIVASASTLRTSFPEHDHTFMEISDNLWIKNTHNDNGNWMYGIDMCILPDFRGLGLSKELYIARTEICKKLGLKGQIIAGMTIGYGKVKHKITIEEYCYGLEIKRFTDPTITPQRKAGFRWIRPLYNHITDPECGFASILMYKPVDEDFKLKI